MPLGISYYTFQGIAYLVALYRGQSPRLGTLQQLLHFGFFPTITSGPIIRAAAFKGSGGRLEAGMAEQIRTAAPRDMVKPALAVSLIVLGIAKKWWLAGTLGESWVDPVSKTRCNTTRPRCWRRCTATPCSCLWTFPATAPGNRHGDAARFQAA